MYPYAHLPLKITDRDYNTMAVSYRLPIAADSDAVASNANTGANSALQPSN
jgi:hypothetical protein